MEEGAAGEVGDAIAALAQPAAAPESDRSERPAEPRPEIWFHRKISLLKSVRELWAFRELVVTLAERDLRVRYKQAVLGIAWAVITPLAMMIAFSLIFTKIGHVNPHSHGIPYPLFSYIGLLPWTFFSTCMTGAGMSLVTNIPLLNKLYCPREVFPIAAMLDAALDAVIASVVLLFLFPIYGVWPTITTVYVPLLLVVLIVFTLGVTLAVSVITVFMRDLRLVLPLVVQFGLFATPVIYAPASLANSQAFMVGYSFINPLAAVLDGFRRCVLYGQPPNWAALGAATFTSVLWLLGGFWLFKRLETRIADVA